MKLKYKSVKLSRNPDSKREREKEIERQCV